MSPAQRISHALDSAIFHAIPTDTASTLLETDRERGLTSEQAKSRLAFFGSNALPEERPPSRLIIFLRQFKSPLIFILAIAGVVTLALQVYTDSIVIWGAVLLNSVVGYSQEYRASRAQAELRKIVKIRATVVRDRQEQEVPQEELVPGDLVILQSGQKVPADGRIVKADGLTINEAVLTGEWLASLKHGDELLPATPLADRENMAYMGSVVEEGKGEMIVSATGPKAELGKVASLVEGIEEELTPYQRRLNHFSWIIGGAVSVAALLIFLQGILRQGEFVEMFTMAVAVAVGAIPEGLPIAVTVILAVGMQRILRRKGLVRRLSSAETLGSASIIATDKTLTLTEGRMEVEQIHPVNGHTREEALFIASMANEAYVENPKALFEKWVLRGRPTDKALLRAALEGGIKTEFQEAILRRNPFDNERKYISVLLKARSGGKIILSGAPETLIQRSNMNQKEIRAIQHLLEELAANGLRLVGVAQASVPQADLDKDWSELVRNLDFVGLIALKDPIRKGVKEAIELTRNAGIRTIMITGDHLLTAKAVARELGIPHEDSNAIDGTTLDHWSDKELSGRLEDIFIYARVEPAHKLRIIQAWQNKGEVIAMTGDGVNDAPALKKADLGIALGSGTDVAKEVADLVLLGDNFAIIPAAIQEGRTIVSNIRKVITYLLSGAFTAVILVGASILFGLPLPVTAPQILWVNLLQDGLPAIALTFEKGEKRLMQRKPEGKRAPILTGQMKVIIFVIGILTDLMLLGIFLWLLSSGAYSLEHIRTFVFAALGIASTLYVFSIKNMNANIWQYNPFSNLYLVGATLLGFVLLIAAVHTRPLQALFHTVPLNPYDWALLFGFGFANVLLIELAKWYFVKGKNNGI